MTTFSTAASTELFARARTLLPGGVNSPVRAMGSIGRDPIFIVAGDGSQITDVDGNRYVDWVCSWGALILGHADPEVVAAVTAAARRGTTFGAPTAAEVELAAEIVGRVPGVEMVRMTSSGTEATISALRLARAVTGRERILKFAGAYHGHVDGLLAQAGSGLATAGIPASPGVPVAAAAATVVVPWNEPEMIPELDDFAAVICEPIPANMGIVPTSRAFLAMLRSATERAGALLIFDEVISGFRVARGGAQGYYGVIPDLTIMGKVVGGGLPAAAYGGSVALMERIAPAGDVYQAGTLSGNPVAVAAALATLRRLDARAYAKLAATTEKLAEGLRQAAQRARRPLCVQSVPGLVTPFFTDAAEVGDYRAAAATDQRAYGAWCRELLARGVYPPASQFEAWFPSLAHSDEDIEQTVAAATAAFEAIG